MIFIVIVNLCKINGNNRFDLLCFCLLFCSVLEKNNTLQVYDDLNDGSTTDGSISILGDHEFNQGRILLDSDDSSTHTPSPQPLQMWMRCTPIDMAICAKRPLVARPRDSNHFEQPTSVNELGLRPQNIVDDVFNYLDRLSSVYLLQVFLLFLTAGLVAILAIIYSRYSACKLEIKDLEQKLYSIKMEKYQIEGNLARCEYLYEMELDKTTNGNVEFKADGDNSDKKMSAEHSESNCQSNDGTCVIQPTKLSDEYVKEVSEDSVLDIGPTVWFGAGDEVIPTKQPFKSKENFLSECNDDSSLFSEYNREYCESRKKYARDALKPESPEKVYSTHYSYKAIDDRECNPSKIDFNLGIEHARKMLRDTNCDDDGTMKYLEEAFDRFQKTKTTKARKELKKLDKTHGKWDKTQKVEHSVIHVGKYDENASEERIDRGEKKERRDKKHRKEKDGDSNKENRKQNNRKDATKKYNQDKDQSKWQKNERKRDTVKVYDHRHD